MALLHKISRAGCVARIGSMLNAHLAVVPILGRTTRLRFKSSHLQKGKEKPKIKEVKARERVKINPIP